ncbi:MAG: FliM/FliN family flagellar motor switch protein [Mariprofundaceae bacterium]
MTEKQEQEKDQSVETEAQSVGEQHENTPNLEALMHIPLDISVELGRIKIPLHDLVRMGRGNVLQMKKEADAKVEILANGSVFARGEVVKADGKLGVRVTDVLPAAERIRALS